MSDSLSEINNILYGKVSVMPSQNTFIFTLNGIDPAGSNQTTPNSEGILYCVCLKLPELVKVTYLYIYIYIFIYIYLE